MTVHVSQLPFTTLHGATEIIEGLFEDEDSSFGIVVALHVWAIMTAELDALMESQVALNNYHDAAEDGMCSNIQELSDQLAEVKEALLVAETQRDDETLGRVQAEVDRDRFDKVAEGRLGVLNHWKEKHQQLGRMWHKLNVKHQKTVAELKAHKEAAAHQAMIAENRVVGHAVYSDEELFQILRDLEIVVDHPDVAVENVRLHERVAELLMENSSLKNQLHYADTCNADLVHQQAHLKATVAAHDSVVDVIADVQAAADEYHDKLTKLKAAVGKVLRESKADEECAYGDFGDYCDCWRADLSKILADL